MPAGCHLVNLVARLLVAPSRLASFPQDALLSTWYLVARLLVAPSRPASFPQVALCQLGPPPCWYLLGVFFFVGQRNLSISTHGIPRPGCYPKRKVPPRAGLSGHPGPANDLLLLLGILFFSRSMTEQLSLVGWSSVAGLPPTPPTSFCKERGLPSGGWS